MKHLLLTLLLAVTNLCTIYAQQDEPPKSIPLSEGVGAGSIQKMPEGLTGKGVLVGVIDSGIDYNHINFRDQNTQKTRIRTAITFTDTFEHYTRANNPEEIAVLPMDSPGLYHGTHVAGIAGGSYAADGYQGIATEADLCLIALNHNTGNLATALREMFAIADSLDLPLALNMSVGSNTEKIDGYGPLCQLLEELTDNGNKPGRIITVSVGNSGMSSFKYKAYQMQAAEDTLSLLLSNDILDDDSDPLSYIGGLDFLVPKSSELKMRAFFYDTEAKTEVNAVFEDNRGNTLIAENIAEKFIVEEIEGSPNRYYKVAIEGSFDSENIVVGFEITAATPCTITFTSDFAPLDSTKTFVEFFDNINIISATPAVISVGSYDSRTAGRTLVDKTSSYGINKYGEKIPDVLAPGAGIISSIPQISGSETSDRVTTRQLPDTDGNMKTYYWYCASGTSMASPYMAGVAALLLQQNPTLTVNQLREYLHKTNTWNDDCENAPYGSLQAGHGVLNVNALFEEVKNNTTGIQQINEMKEEISHTVYNLNGQLSGIQPSHGLYIKNGRVLFQK